jgi:hypothetical protein
MKVKIFGERNTGTRALTGLLERNSIAQCLPGTEKELAPERFLEIHKDEPAMDELFSTVPAAFAWKHCATYFDDISSLEDCQIIFTVRHPLSWLVGLFDRPYHHLAPIPDTIAEFASQPWKTVKREYLGERSYTPLELYRQKLLSYLSAPFEGRFVKFEDIVLDPEEVLRSFGSETAILLLDSTKPNDPRSLKDMQAYYREERWRERIDGILEEPDWGLFSRFGYCP